MNRSVWFLVLWGAGLCYWRLSLQGWRSPGFALADNPTSREPRLLVRCLTFLYLPAFNFLLLVHPSRLSFDWSMDAIPRVESVDDPRNFVTFVFYLWLYRCFKKGGRLLMISALVAIPFLPATNLLFYVGFVVAERLLYLPSVGFCYLVGLAYFRLSAFLSSRLLKASLALVLLAFAAKTVHRNFDWGDEERLFRSATSINPPKGNAK